LFVDIAGVLLTPVFAGGWLGLPTLLGALEEAVDRLAKACLAAAATVRTRIEHGQRGRDAFVTALAGRYAFAISSRI